MTLLIHILTSNQTTLMWFHGLYYSFSSLYWPIFDWPSFSQFLTVWALIRLVWKLLTSGVLPAPQKGEKFISGATGKDIQVSKWLLDLENTRNSWEEGKKGRGEGKKKERHQDMDGTWRQSCDRTCPKYMGHLTSTLYWQPEPFHSDVYSLILCDGERWKNDTLHCET